MQMPLCRRLWCLTDLHPRHPTTTPAMKLRLLQSCQSPRQAAFEDLRCLPPPEQRPLPVGKPTLTAAPPATTDRKLLSVRGGDPQPLQHKNPLVHASRVFQALTGAWQSGPVIKITLTGVSPLNARSMGVQLLEPSVLTAQQSGHTNWTTYEQGCQLRFFASRSQPPRTFRLGGGDPFVLSAPPLHSH